MQWIKNFLADRSYSVKIDQDYSSEITIKSGVPQGSVLGPILFNFYVHDILKNDQFPDINIKSFADDTKAYVEFSRNDLDYTSKLQKFIDYFYKWCLNNGLNISILKCRILHIGLNNPKLDYNLNGDLIPKVVDNIRDLGLYVTPNLKWATHIRTKCRLANGKFFNILKAFKSNDPKFLVRLYTCYVRPILEFASPVFNSDIIGNCNMIEAVQRRVTRAIIRRCFKSYRIIPKYEKRLALLGLDKLKARFIKLDLIMAHKYKLGLISVNSKSSSNLSQMKIKRGRSSIYVPSANNTVRNNTFFVRAFKRYIKLKPNLLICPTLSSFKSKIDKINFE